jgi:predicted anti-sigma-YlaC factor YlaD
VLALDGELQGVLGTATLEGHLRSCAACARFAETVTTAAELVRSAPLEPHTVDALRLRRLRARRLGLRALPAAAASTIALGVGLLAAPLVGIGSTEAPTRPGAALRAPTTPLKLPIGQRSAAADFLSV